MTDFHVIIPARYHSTRLPGKLLLKLGNKTILERVYLQAMQSGAASVTIATDSELIAEAASHFATNILITAEHPSGTDRVAEVVKRGNYQTEDIIVNVQGDEPFIPPELICQVANTLANCSAEIATLCWPLEYQEQLHNPNVVKVVRNQFNEALYFSRSSIPYHRDEPDSIKHLYRHIGLYAYRASFLLHYDSLMPCDLEKMEMLEQLRVLWAGGKIKVEQACLLPRQDINTLEDLHHAERILESALD